MTPLDSSILLLLRSYQAERPGEFATLKTIFKTVVLPFWGHEAGNEVQLLNTLDALPASALYGLLSTEDAGWCAPLRQSLPAGDSYQRAYCRYIKRLIAHGEARGLLHPDQFLITPAWRFLMRELEPLIAQESPSKRSALRCALKRLAKWATEAGVSPEAIPVQQADERVMAPFWKIFPPDRDGGFYQARAAWAKLVSVQPQLRAWDAGPVTSFQAMPRAAWPPVFARGLAALFEREGLGSWRPETRKGYVHRLGSYLGILAQVGIETSTFLEPLKEGTDALRLMFQGLPPGWPRLEAQELACRLAEDAGFRESLLGAMRELDGCFEGRASESNPFLLLAVSMHVEAKKITSAKNLLFKALAINRGLLGLTERHTHWLSRRLSLLSQLARKNPSRYTLKKRAVFRHPYLWAELVRGRGRLRDHTFQLETAWRQASGSRRAYLKRRWAIALRNEVLFGLLLCYPLRANNVLEMTVGRHYRREAHHIFFAAEETKNQKEIDYELPDGGSLGELRVLIDQYLDEARPVLLAGRRSPYFFVPESRGGIRLRSKGIHAILADLSHRFFQDLLPKEVKELNPHLLRHVTASYHLAIGGNLNLAAQMLNDSPSTITQAYADVLEHKKEATKRFLSGFTA